MAKKDVSNIITALKANFAIFITKAVAWHFTRSTGMAAEAIHSLVDCANQILLLIGAEVSSKPADAKHPFGYGKYEYIFCITVGELLISVGGSYSVWEGIEKLSNPHAVSNPYLGLLVFMAGFIFEAWSWCKVWKSLGKPALRDLFDELRKLKSGDDVVVMMEDTAALLGLLIGAVGLLMTILTGNPVYDAITSIAVGILLIVTAIILVAEMVSLTVGEAVAKPWVRYVRRVLNDHPSILKFGHIRTMQLGGDECEIAVDVDFDHEMMDSDIEETIKALREKIRRAIPAAKYIHLTPTRLV